MGPPPKRTKRVPKESGSSSAGNSDPESEFPSTFSDEPEEADHGSRSRSEGESGQDIDPGSDSEQEDHDGSGSGSDGESDQEIEMMGQEEEEEDSGNVEGKNDAEMDELEKEYRNLRNEEQDLLKNLKHHQDEDAIKGQAVKNQKLLMYEGYSWKQLGAKDWTVALWDKSLELRFLLQKAFSSSNKLPQEPVRSQFCNTEGVVAQAYTDLISSSEQTLSSMLELQKALIEKNPAIVEGTYGNKNENCKDGSASNDLKEEDKDWLQVHKMHDRLVAFRNNSVDKWQRKTQVTTGAAAFKGKLQAFNQNISEQVAGYMRDPSRMIKRMQLRASTVTIFGKVPGDSESKDTDENADGNPELLDDSEFYQQLLKEFFESCDIASSEKAFYDLKRLQPKKRKIVDRRASKSRKIRYNVHEKIVNFMAPLPMALPPMAPKLFANLFGCGNGKPTST